MAAAAAMAAATAPVPALVMHLYALPTGADDVSAWLRVVLPRVTEGKLRPADQLASVIGWLAARAALAAAMADAVPACSIAGCRHALAWTRTSTGRPCVVGADACTARCQLDISVSHQGRYVCVAAAALPRAAPLPAGASIDRPLVGIDIMDWPSFHFLAPDVPAGLATLDAVLAPAERAAVADCPPSAAVATLAAIWTAKEAVYKVSRVR